ncbi:hypothetical protein [Methanobrevibacter sp.]|uniref:hypothetical protein n=1 Tax=Methanobrevibacter sp. TaxID=66852 RepID=UPI00388F89FA
MNLLKSEITSNRNINYRDLMIFAVPILIFALYLFIYNPGILTYDSFAQIHQIASGEFTNRFPFFHTFIEMLLLNIFHTPLAIVALQILVFSAIWTVICKYHRDDASESSNKFTLQFIVTLIICLIPINAVYSVTLWPEILFSYALLFLSFLIKVLIDRNGEMSLKFAVILAVTIAVTSQLSSIGIYIGIITLIAILAYLFKKNRNKEKTFLILPALTIILILAIGSLSIAYSVEDAHAGNSPGSAQMVWSVLRGDDWDGQAYYLINGGDYLKEAQNRSYTENKITPTADYEKLTSTNFGKGNYNLINSYAVYFKDHTITDTLFLSPALYMYLAIILLIAIQLITKSKDMYLVYVPNLINIIGVFMTATLNENRFLYPNLLVFYMMVIIFISIYFRRNTKTLPVTLNTQKTEEPPSQMTYENAYDVSEDYFDSQIEPMAPDESISDPETPEEREYDSDLIDQILKEMEMDKKEGD